MFTIPVKRRNLCMSCLRTGQAEVSVQDEWATVVLSAGTTLSHEPSYRRSFEMRLR